MDTNTAPTVVRFVLWPGILFCDASFLRGDGLTHLYCVDPDRGLRVDAVGTTMVDAVYNMISWLNFCNSACPWTNLPVDKIDHIGDVDG
jgi:hypothetical protein